MRVTQRRGDIAVAQAVATFTALGFDVALPITESAAYDIIVDNEEGFHGVQVRFASTREVGLRRIHSNSRGYVVKKTKSNAYDWLYVLNSMGEEFLIRSCLDGRRSIRTQEQHLIVRNMKLKNLSG